MFVTSFSKIGSFFFLTVSGIYLLFYTWSRNFKRLKKGNIFYRIGEHFLFLSRWFYSKGCFSPKCSLFSLLISTSLPLISFFKTSQLMPIAKTTAHRGLRPVRFHLIVPLCIWLNSIFGGNDSLEYTDNAIYIFEL